MFSVTSRKRVIVACPPTAPASVIVKLRGATLNVLFCLSYVTIIPVSVRVEKSTSLCVPLTVLPIISLMSCGLRIPVKEMFVLLLFDVSVN